MDDRAGEQQWAASVLGGDWRCALVCFGVICAWHMPGLVLVLVILLVGLVVVTPHACSCYSSSPLQARPM